MNKNKMSNDKLVDYLENISSNVSKLSGEKLGGGFQTGKTVLSKTNRDARIIARADAAVRGESIDESETPPGELDSAVEDIMDNLLKRKIKSIFED